jgi:hypothetical protein
VAVYRGGASYVRAPSSPSFSQFPENRPFAAFDGDPRTFWAADPTLEDPRHWVEIGFDRPRDVDHIDVLPHADPRVTVTSVSVAGHTFRVHPGWNRLPLGLRGVRSLRVAIAGHEQASKDIDFAGGFDEIRVPGVRPAEYLRPPLVAERALAGRDLSATSLSYLFERQTGDRPFARGSVPPPVDPRDRRNLAQAESSLVLGAGDAETGLARIFTPPAARSWRADGWGSVDPGARDSVLDRLVGFRRPERFDSSSRFEGAPGHRASSAFDGGPNTAWIGSWSPGRAMWISWQTPRPARVTTLRLTTVDGVRAPRRIRLSWPGGRTPPLAVGRDGSVTLPQPAVARSYRLDVLDAEFPQGATAQERTRLAVGIADLQGPGIPAVRVPRAGSLAAPCGVLRADVGGGSLSLRIAADVAAFDSGMPLRLLPCGPPLALPASTVTLTTRRGLLRPYLLRLSSPSPVAHAAPAVGGRVTGVGSSGRGRYKDIKLSVTGPAWLVLGESYNRGWRASCDGRSLGAPQPIDGFGNGWRVDRGCTTASITFGPNRTQYISYVISGVACALMLAFLLWKRRRPAAVPSPGDIEVDDSRRALPWRSALALGVASALVFGFLFALRAGVMIGPAVALITWRGVPPRRLIAVATGLLAVAVPLVYLIWPADDQGGYDTRYAIEHLGAHWVAVAGFVLLALALRLTLSTATRTSRAPAPAGAAEPPARA